MHIDDAMIRHDDLQVIDGVELPPEAGRAIYWPDQPRSFILLDRSLTGPEKHAALVHELVHHERRGVHDTGQDLWWSRLAIEEKIVNREAAARLVPVDQLADFCDRMADLGIGVGPVEVMAEFDVARWVAEQALDNLTAHERGKADG